MNRNQDNKGLEMNAFKAVVFSGIALAAITLSAPTYADDATPATTGTQLIKICNEKIEADNGDAWVMCALYIRGIVEGLQWGIQMGIVLDNTSITTEELHKKFHALWFYCQPYNVSTDEVARVVTNFITEHPNDLNKTASTLVMAAYVRAWPCTFKK